MSFSESRRRPMRGKPHHNSRRNHHQQPTWAAECAPAPAPQQWQQQPPVVADANFAGYQQE